MMNTDTKKQIETALRAFSASDLRAASISLLNSLGYQSEKTLDLDNTPEGEPCLDLCFLKLRYLERDLEFFIYFDRI